MLALCLMLLGTYYAQNYASIIGGCLVLGDVYSWFWEEMFTHGLVGGGRCIHVYSWFWEEMFTHGFGRRCLLLHDATPN